MTPVLKQKLNDLVQRENWTGLLQALRKYGLLSAIDFPYEIGDKILIRGARYYYCGVVSNLTSRWVSLEEAVWVADTGRFSEVLHSGFHDSESETEKYRDEVHVPIDTILDVTLWRHEIK